MHGSRLLLACLLSGCAAVFGSGSAIAQVIPDQTLGNESSIVTPNVEVNGNRADTIDGGAIRGSNLFHSFSKFSIGEGERLYFSSPVDIENIFSRVTGGNITIIEGLLGTRGDSDATLMLINPNGFVFGENATLDVQGSFAATTAAGIELGEAGRFSATNPNSDNLLSIQPSAFFFENLGSQPTIKVATQGQSDFFLDLLNERAGGLSVSSKESISLIGGDVLLENATINARGGQVVLGSVLGEGTVDLTSQGFSFSNSGERGNIRIDDSSYINVKENPSGGILLFADDIDILSGSSLLAGSGTDSVELQGGDLAINANGAVTISNSTLENTLNIFATGVSGDIKIESQELSLEDGGVLQTGLGNAAEGISGNIILEVGTLSLNNRSEIRADTLGRGDAGNIFIRSDGAVALNGMSRISSINADAIGDGGEINIRASDIEVIDVSEITTDANGEGSGGILKIISNEILLSDSGSLRSSTSGLGDAGSIQLEVERLRIRNGGFIIANTFSSGQGGELIINANESISISGATQNPFLQTTDLNASGIYATSNNQGEGKGGSIRLTTDMLSILDGGTISTNTFGNGEGGNIFITANFIEVAEGVSDQSFSSAISSSSQSGAFGDAGNISIFTRDLSVRNGGFVASTARSRSSGDAGNVNISATGNIEIVGTTLDGDPSGFEVGVGEGDPGNAGSININTQRLSLRDGGSILAQNIGTGSSGSIDIFARESVEVISGEEYQSKINSGINSNRSVANNNRISIRTRNLRLLNGGQVLSNTIGTANANDIIVNATDSVEISGISSDGWFPSGLSAGSGFDQLSPEQLNRVSGAGGNIIVQTNDLKISEQGEISASAFGDGRSGNINVIADNISIQTGGEIAAGTSGRGDGGNISIDTDRLRITGGGFISTSTDGLGDAGSLTINATEAIDLSGTTSDGSVRSNLNAITYASGRGGDLLLSVPYLSITGGAGIAVATFGDGDAGSLKIQNADLVEIIGSSNAEVVSRLNAQTGEGSTGQGGSIEIQSNTLRIADDALITARSLGTGTAGKITLNITDRLHLLDGGITTEALNSSGGNITIRSSDSEAASISGVVILDGDSDITTESLGDGGDITIQMPVVAFDDSDILARSQSANGGNITLSAFFSDPSPSENPPPFEDNDKVDINADGDLAPGDITITDTGLKG